MSGNTSEAFLQIILILCCVVDMFDFFLSQKLILRQISLKSAPLWVTFSLNSRRNKLILGLQMGISVAVHVRSSLDPTGDKVALAALEQLQDASNRNYDQ